MTLNLSSIWPKFSRSTMARGSLSTTKCKGCGCGVCHQTPAPQWHIWGKARSRLKYGLGVLHVSPPWVEGPMPDQIRVVGSQWVWEWSYRHSHRERVQHLVVYSWKASHMMGRNACSGPAQNGGHPHVPSLRLPNLPYLRLGELLGCGQMGESDPPQWRYLRQRL